MPMQVQYTRYVDLQSELRVINSASKMHYEIFIRIEHDNFQSIITLFLQQLRIHFIID